VRAGSSLDHAAKKWVFFGGGFAMTVVGSAQSPPVSPLAARHWTFWAAMVACTWFAVLIRGYSFGVDDQALYLPFLYHWNAPALFPHDYLLTLGFTRESITWPGLAVIGRWTGYPPLFLALYVLTTFLSLLLVYLIAQNLWDKSGVAWLAVFLWVPVQDIPGAGISTFDSYFTTRCIGSVVALAAVYALLKNRPVGS
jgi:hypothetical protein